jgi:hypothetical protein
VRFLGPTTQFPLLPCLAMTSPCRRTTIIHFRQYANFTTESILKLVHLIVNCSTILAYTSNHPICSVVILTDCVGIHFAIVYKIGFPLFSTDLVRNNIRNSKHSVLLWSASVFEHGYHGITVIPGNCVWECLSPSFSRVIQFHLNCQVVVGRKEQL